MEGSVSVVEINDEELDSEIRVIRTHNLTGYNESSIDDLNILYDDAILGGVSKETLEQNQYNATEISITAVADVDIASQNDDDGNPCFPTGSIVEFEGERMEMIENLKVLDTVKTAGSSF